MITHDAREKLEDLKEDYVKVCRKQWNLERNMKLRR